MSSIYVLHENDTWVEPLREEFHKLGLPYKEWFLDEGIVPYDSEPPQGVFYNRMSSSSHTRGHRYAPELTHSTLQWLELHDRRIINNSRALYLETSKLAQYSALQKAGVQTPRTIAASGPEKVLEAARVFGPEPFIIKPNRGGKGLGVQLVSSPAALNAILEAAEAEQPIDGIWLLQDYIRSADQFITRCEFVGGRFLYAVRVDTSQGFELCPADACSVDEAFCPVDAPQPNIFSIDTDFHEPELIEAYTRFLAENGIEIAGIEFIRDKHGAIYTYDVNTNTNYNGRAEAQAAVQRTGMQAIADFLGEELARAYTRSKTAVS